jgi:cystathionine beta-synthase/cysteine synthase A
MGVGTGGTLTGTAKRLKKEWPNIKIIGVDPEGSILAGGNEIDTYQVEGIGYDFLPEVFDQDIVDEFYKSNDHDSFNMARQLIQKEGLLCGGSSGAAVCGLIEAAKDLKAGQKALVLLPDSIRNYLGKYVSNDWLNSEGFSDIIEQMPTYATKADIKE